MALTKEDLQAMADMTRAIVKEELRPIKADIEQIKKDTTITREAVNSLIEWTDEVSGVVEVRFPVKKKQA